MEVQLLKEQGVFPSADVLRSVLGQVYDVWAEMETRLTQDEFGLTFEWRYYNDSKMWLCKVDHKKKTVFWGAVYEGCFKTTFFFLERHLAGIADLDISEQIKEDFCRAKPIGKLLPMVIGIDRQEQLADLLKIVKFKKKSK